MLVFVVFSKAGVLIGVYMMQSKALRMANRGDAYVVAREVNEDP